MRSQFFNKKREGKVDSSGNSAIYKFTLLFLGWIVIFLILLVKSETASSALSHPVLLIYTIFVTSFQLSRVISAMLYRAPTGGGTCQASDFEPTVSIVIPCKNEEASIEKTVRSSFAAEYPSEKLEVIVINDGSTDRTGEILQNLKKDFPHLVVLDWKVNQGKRHGMYAGFTVATGEIVVQLDSDSYFEPHTFREIIDPFRNPRIGAVCAHADPENADTNMLTKMQAAYYFMSFRILKAAESTFQTVFCCSGCSSAYRKELLMPILKEWLDETFMGLPVTWGDDRALTNWVLKLGYDTVYTDKAKAYTICPDNLKQLLTQQVRWKKGWMVNSFFASKWIMKKHSFVALTYFFPLILVTVLAPFMALNALVVGPILDGHNPVYYFLGVILVASVITIFYRYVSRENKYWPYMFLWSILNMFILSFVLFYAVVSIQNRKWGTR